MCIGDCYLPKKTRLHNIAKLDKEWSGLVGWAEIPDVGILKCYIPAFPDERIYPVECDPAKQGRIVFWTNRHALNLSQCRP